MAVSNGMRTILLINPNTSAASLQMMLAIARPLLPPGIALRGLHAEAGPPMITSEAELIASGHEVTRLALGETGSLAAIIVAAFGDPGVATLRGQTIIPVIGIGEASMREAAQGDRRFGIATSTKALAPAMAALVASLGLAPQFTGVRTPDTDARMLASDPARQEQALGKAVTACIGDGAEAVIIGGGPLSDAAKALRAQFETKIVEPVPAAVRAALRLLQQPPA